MTHSRALLALTLLLLAVSCTGTHPQPARSPGGTPGTGAVSPSPTAANPTLTPGWPTQVISLGTPPTPAASATPTPGSTPNLAPGTVTPYAVTQDAVFGLWDLPGSDQAAAVPVAQPAGPTRSGSPTIGQPISGASSLVLAGGWVWVVTDPGSSASAQLYQLNRTSLTVVSQRALPVAVTELPNSGGELAQQDASLAATPNWLWVAAGQDLFRVDAATGSWTGPFPQDGELSSISADPSGRLLYTGGETAAGSPTVREYSGSTGSLFRQVTVPSAIVAPEVAATATGVWVGYRTGMSGAAELLSSQSLTHIEPPPSYPGQTELSPFDQVGGVDVSVSDGALWLSGQSSLSCADPRTSAVGATETVSSPPVVVAGDGVLYGSDAGALDIISPPAICFG